MTSRRSCEVSSLDRVAIDCLLMRVIDDEGNESSRSLGLIVARGTLLVLISPVDGSEEIANPFQQQDEE